MPIATLSSFLLAATLLALAPGPDNLYVLSQSALHGRLAGLLLTLGLCTGLIVHTLAVAFGVAALLQASPAAFAVLKLVGAAYLLYLAWQLWTHAREPATAPREEALTNAQRYRRGIVMNVSNPKVAVFFLAFLPQFADPDRGPLIPQLLLLGGLFAAVTIVVFGGIACLADFAGPFLRRSPTSRRWLSQLTALILTALALTLAFRP